MKLLFTISLILISITCLFSQNWEMVQTFGGSGNESLDALEIMDDENIIIAGSFEQSMDIDGNNLTSEGEEDIYCSIYDVPGQHLQSFQMGGPFEERLAGVTTSGDKITLLGSYNIEATFDDITLQTSLGTKGLFISQYNTSGDVQWAHSIEGNILSISGGITSNDNGDIFIAGYFYDTLIIQTDTILANSTQGDLFVAQFNEQGDVQWISQAGNQGIMRCTAIVIDSNSDLIISGKFKGEATFGTQTIQTNTSDQDIFVAKLNNSGDFIWGKKLGGVFEDDLGDITVDSNDNIYITGYFLGVISSSDGWEIQSNGFSQNAYLIQISSTGIVNWGHSLGANDDEYSIDVNTYDDVISITGYFSGTTNWGSGDLISEGGLDAYIANFDINGNFLDFNPIKGEEFEIGNQVKHLPTGQIITGGSFNGSCTFDQTSYPSNGFYDVYWAIQNNAVPIKEIENKIDFSFYPNPVSEGIYWQSSNAVGISLVDILGRVLFSESKTEMLGYIYVGDLSPGIYFLKIHETLDVYKVVVN